MTDIGRLLLTLAAFATVSVGALEGLARVWTRLATDPLQRALPILRPDSELGWRQRENLDTRFMGFPLHTDGSGFRVVKSGSNKIGKPKVLVLGPSSAFGWGVDAEDTYSEQIQSLYPDLKTFNAGQIGFGFLQGTVLWRKYLADLNPEYVVVAFGVNDIDRYRFLGTNGLSDANFFDRGPDRILRPWERVDLPGYLWPLVSRSLSELAWMWPCPPERPPETRVSIAAWRTLLIEFGEILERNRAVPIFLTSAYRFPFERNPASAVEGERLYLESARNSRDRSCSSARRLYREARRQDGYQILEGINKLNEITGSLSPRFNVVHIDQALNEQSDFVDPIHPSVKGHGKIAKLVTATILNLDRR